MKVFEIEYRDEDPGCPVFTWRCRAHDKEHARDKFLDGLDGDGWEICSIRQVRS